MKKIVIALKNLEGANPFSAKVHIPLADLSISIKPVGTLTYPLNDRSIRALIKVAKPAQFGWREQTLTDKTVRDAWEIDKSLISISGDAALATALESIKEDLGLPESATLKASLHSLLIYKKGQFFSAHQDSEKENGMIATLVLILPSSHSGGDLVIDHQGKKETFCSDRLNINQYSGIAFYADCHHEVQPVKRAHRIVLTFNLLLEFSKNTIASTTPYKPLINAIQESFKAQAAPKEYAYQEQKAPKIIYLLDHEYTKKGLSWSHLKGADRSRAEAFKTAAEAVGCDIYLALADVQETWGCEQDQDYGCYRHYDRYPDDEDENDYDDYGTHESDPEPTALIDSSTILKHWLDRDGQVLPYGEYTTSSCDDLCWTADSEDFKPFESEYEGFMGNYGNTLDRWYHRAAIVLWQKQDHYSALFQIQPGKTIVALLDLAKQDLQAFSAMGLIPRMLPALQSFCKYSKNAEAAFHLMSLAVLLQDHALSHKLLQNFDLSILIPAQLPAFLALQKVYGTPWCLQLLKEWGSEECKNLSKLISALSSYSEISDWLICHHFIQLKKRHLLAKKGSVRNLLENTSKYIAEVIDLLHACAMGQHEIIHQEVIDHMISSPDLYDPLLLAGSLKKLKKKLGPFSPEAWGYEKLKQYLISTLKIEHDQGTHAADDWSIKTVSSCTCADCKILNIFLQSVISKNLIWPLAKDRRSHIHGKITDLCIPVTHETQHIGSPHKLILTKTPILHEAAKQRFCEVTVNLERLTQEY